MYDYATVTKQNQIIQELQTVNQSIEDLNTELITTLNNQGIFIGVLLIILLLEAFFRVITGMKK